MGQSGDRNPPQHETGIDDHLKCRVSATNGATGGTGRRAAEAGLRAGRLDATPLRSFS